VIDNKHIRHYFLFPLYLYFLTTRLLQQIYNWSSWKKSQTLFYTKTVWQTHVRTELLYM